MKTILYINGIRPATVDALAAYNSTHDTELKAVVLFDTATKDLFVERNRQAWLDDKGITNFAVDFGSSHEIRNFILYSSEKIDAVTCQFENSIQDFKRILPYFPYLPSPSETTLEWATSKSHMRTMFQQYDPSITPRYTTATEYSDEKVTEIVATLSFPLVIKPSGLAGSVLVTFVNTTEELQQSLTSVFKKIEGMYKTRLTRKKPVVVVEEFMVGDMYSVDSYVTEQGTCIHAPLVRVLTGRSIGFKDFFGYMRLTPTDLDETDTALALRTAEKACQALGLKATTAHIELMRTAAGWKVIELGPRIGEFRHELYMNAFGINHIVNDAQNKMKGESPDTKISHIKHSALFLVFARHRGTLDSVKGVETVKKLDSLDKMHQVVQIGEKVDYCENDGSEIFEIMLSNYDRKKLMNDIKTMQSSLVFGVATEDKSIAFSNAGGQIIDL